MSPNIKCAYDELIDTHKLQPNPKNPNKHPEKQILRLAKIIDYQGMRSPIVVSNRSGFITKGHGRLEALKALKWDKVPVNFQEYEDEAQEYADMVADNAIAEWAAQDLSEINMEMLELGPDFDVDMLGIEDFVIEPVEKYGEEGQDDVPEVTHEPITKRGDVWVLGNHRVMCGDSTMIDDVEKLMNGEKAEFIYTDPPYGISLDTDYSKMSKGGYTYKKVANDDKPFDPCFILDTFFNVEEIFIWGAENFLPVQEPLGSWVVWDKSTDNSDDCFFANPIELCWSKKRHKYGIYRKYWRMMAAKEAGEKRVHPTQKPIAMAEWFFEKYVEKLNLCLDLFLGSGSTLIACEKTNRKCYGMELDEHYCDVIVERWQKFTGKEAVLESNGKRYNEMRDERES